MFPSTRHSYARAAQEFVDLAAGHQAEIARDAELERGCRGREADGVVPASGFEAAHDQAARERVTGAKAVHNLGLVPRRGVDLAFTRADPRRRIVPQGDRHRAELESLRERLSGLGTDAEDHA